MYRNQTTNQSSELMCVVRRKGHLSLLSPRPSKAGVKGMSYVVRPIYFQDGGQTVRRLYLIFDVNSPRYEYINGRSTLVPLYAIPSSGSVINELANHFSRNGIPRFKWKVTPPVLTGSVNMVSCLGSAKILDPDTTDAIQSA